MRHVCMLGTSPESKGGIGSVIRGFVEDIHPDGYSFEHIVTHADCGATKKIYIAGAALIRCAFSMKLSQYDLVHIHSAFGMSFTRSIPFIRMASARGVPLVNHIHADDWKSFYEDASDKKKRTIAEVYACCDKIIALSQEWADALSAVVPEEKIAVLENFTPVYEKDFIPNWNSRTVIFMSRLERIKGCDILPEICAKVIARVPDARFLICGEGSMGDSLLAELKRRHLDNQVELLGWIDGDRKVDVLKQGSVFLLPSYGEGMPMCILEAMGLGLPVVATNVGGIPRIVRSGVNGMLCAPGDAAAIADAIIRILSNADSYSAMSVNSKSTAAKHSVSVYSLQLESLYDELLGPEQ